MLFRSAPAPAHEGPLAPTPDVRANIYSRAVFGWTWPLLKIGYSRRLEQEDLYELDEPRRAATVGLQLERHFYDRVPPHRRPLHLRPPGSPIARSCSSSKAESSFEEPPTSVLAVGTDAEGREGGTVLGPDGKKYDQSLSRALLKTFAWPFWTSGAFLVVSALLQTLSPMVTKQLLLFITDSYTYSLLSPEEVQASGLQPPGTVSRGIGLAFALFAMQEAASLFQNQYMQRGLSVGMLMRTSLIANISRKSLRLSGAARVRHPNGHLITLVSSDSTFMEWSSFLLHSVWVQPLQILLGVSLLLANLGYSALVGVAIIVLNTPIQSYFVRSLMRCRKAQLKKVDHRVRLIQEVLNGIRVVKLYAYERMFLDRITRIREEELASLRSIGIARAGMSSSMSFVPIAATIFTFVTYALSGHRLDAATIFASLQLFNVIRQPLNSLPKALAVTSDAYVALKRITKALLSEELDGDTPIDLSATVAIRAMGDFAWDTSSPPDSSIGAAQGLSVKAEKARVRRLAKEAKSNRRIPSFDIVLPEKKLEVAPFELRGINIAVPRGSFVCIVGSIGSGKSSLLQGLIGEMKKLNGSVVFGGSTSYCAQYPWVRNATLRDNILFGQPFDEKRFAEIITACALEPDIAILSYGLDTEIGEKGITLSGGQKARVCLARAAYFDSDIVLLDDPLSAVDAHVTKHLIDHCITTGPLAAKTRILVTHHLEVLPHADHIIMMDSGRISEQGLYEDLVKNGGAFSRLIAESGSSKEERVTTLIYGGTSLSDSAKPSNVNSGDGGRLMQQEERESGATSFAVYSHYLESMGSIAWGPILIAIYGFAQAFSIANIVFLGLWSSMSIPRMSSGGYMLTYAAFGVASGLFTFVGTFLMYLRGRAASYTLFNEALHGVMRSKISWFDTVNINLELEALVTDVTLEQTPTGRITSRLSKDITTLDNQLPMHLNQLAGLIFSVFGTIGLVLYTYPMLGLVFIPLFFCYLGCSWIYRASSREIKRIDSIQRSFIYSSFSETLSGMATIRAFRSQHRFVNCTETAIDAENQAYFLRLTLQRWLGVRLDFLGNLLILGIALFGVGRRDTISPAKLGVVLTYSLSVTQSLSQLVSVVATVEQDMNTVERVVHYAHLPDEGALQTPDDPPASWPSAGVLEFSDVKMRYREGLPEVLRGVSFRTLPAEKVGIVGRTGAGKSSILQALFRMCAVSGGKIEIDGVDISKIGLDVLRKRLSVIPQDALLYTGTIRHNLDPTGEKGDAELNSALCRAGLVAGPDASEDVKSRLAKFKLDANVMDEGGNFSAGERQLVALCRALVKGSKIIVLDEATSSVDAGTDASVQQAIQVEFKDQSVLCIAHRLATIAFYDRVMVVEDGRVVEFDEPVTLFDRRESIFRGLCEDSGIGRGDLQRIRRAAGKEMDI